MAKSVSPTFWPAPPPGAWDVIEVWGTHRWTYSPSLVENLRFAHYEIYTGTLCHSYLHEKQISRIQSLNDALYFGYSVVETKPFPYLLRIGLTFDLDLWPTDLNIDRDYVLIKDYLPTKFEASWAKCFWVISCTRLRETDIPTDRPTYRPTCATQYAPPSSKGGINIALCL